FDLFPKEERSDAPHLVATQAALQRVAKGSGEHFMYRSPLSVVHKTVLLFTLAISLYGIYLAYWVTRRWNEASAPVPPRVGITSEEKYLSELIELAQSALDRKDFSQALRYGKQSLIATRDSSVRAEALSILAQAQLGLGKLSEASELLARAQQVDSNLKIDSRVLDAVRYAPPLPKSSGVGFWAVLAFLVASLAMFLMNI
ncbi:MAG: tetratricopeptide repeat protein, partial [Polyangiaceae bacterium]|nr:tetratricopeptide repeat protein [Polyangiaceae bacterium]